jgi:uncharacterized protein DUF6188
MRELPGGGWEFLLEDPSLSFIRIDEQSRLDFGGTEVVIGGPFVVRADGVTHRLDPRRTDALGPLLSLFPGSLRWLWTSADGVLTAVFENGATLTVGPDPLREAWSVGSLYCPPTGGG